MTQEEKSLLLKDLCARLPYGVMVNAQYKDGEGWKTEDRKILGLYKDGQVYLDCVYTTIDCIKPYLRPMSSMTEEERDEVEEISHGWFYINEDGEIFPTGRLTDSGEFEDAILPTFEYFLKTHIDYRGLIEKGLALEAKEGMYEY